MASQPVGNEFLVNTIIPDRQQQPAIAIDGDGDFVVVWRGYQDTDGDGYEIYARRFDQPSEIDGSEQPLDANDVLINADSTTGSPGNPAVAMDSDGDFVVVWDKYGPDAQFNTEIVGRTVASDATLGAEFTINEQPSNTAINPDVSMDDDGDFVVVWQSYEGFDNGDDIYARQYNSNGTPVAGEFLVNDTLTADTQKKPVVAVDSDGDFVVAWQGLDDSSGQTVFEVYAQRYNSAGIAQGDEFLVNETSTGVLATALNVNDIQIDVAIADNGNFVVVWQTQDSAEGDRLDIYARLFNSDGTPQGDEFLVNTVTAGNQSKPTVSMNANGNFIVTWEAIQPGGNGLDIYAQLFNAAGIPQGDEFLVNSFTNNTQINSTVALDDEGDFVIAWQGEGGGGDSYDIYAQQYRPSTIVEFIQAEYQVNEDGTAEGVEFTLTREGDVSGVSVVDVALLAGGTAIAGDDFTDDFPSSVTFAANQVSATVAVNIIDDADIEDPETLFFELTNGNNANIGLQNTASLTILDNDESPTVSFSEVNFSVNEDVAAGTATISLSRIGELGNPSVVQVSITDGDATPTDDYDASGFPTSVTFAVNESIQTIDIPIVDDEVLEATETITFDITVANEADNANLGAQSTTTLAIADDEIVPTINLSAATYTVTETVGGSVATLTLTREGNLTAASTVEVDIIGGTATDPDDYDGSSFPLPVTFAVNATSATVEIPIVDDQELEPTETINVQLINPELASLGDQASAVVQIEDNEVAPGIAFQTDSVVVNEDAGTAVLNLVRTGDSNDVSVVDVEFRFGGTAFPVLDFENDNLPARLTFASGVVNQSVTISIIDDNLIEPDETANFLITPVSNATIGSQSFTILTIVNDDQEPEINFSDAVYQFNEDGTTVGTEVTLTRSGSTGNPSSAQVSLSDGTAIAGSDYDNAGFPMMVSFSANVVSQSITIPILQDTEIEDTESLTLSLTPITNSRLGNQSVSTLQILDDDQPPTIQFSQTEYQVNENSTPAGNVVTLTRTGLLDDPSTVRFLVIDGTATGGASAATGADYNNVIFPLDLTFASGQDSLQLNLPIFQDEIEEGNETINLSIVGVENTTLGTNDSSVLTILDDDGVIIGDDDDDIGDDDDDTGDDDDDDDGGVEDDAIIQIVQTNDATTVSEDGDTDIYTIALTTSPTDDVVITLTPDNEIDLGNGAGVAVDLTFLASSPAGTPQTVTVSAVDDDEVEGDHTGTIVHTAASNDANYNGNTALIQVDGVVNDTVSVDITDNDEVDVVPAVLITQTNGSTEISEDGDTDIYQVALATIPTDTVTITLNPNAQLDLGEGAGVAIELTFAADETALETQQVRVTADDDDENEGNHRGRIIHSASSTDSNYDGDGATILVDDVESDRIVATITDNDVITPDDPAVIITQTRGSTDVSEAGDTDSYLVALNSIPTDTVTVTLNPNGQLDLGNGAGRAIELTFAADATALETQRVRVSAVDDSAIEGDHQGRIIHSTTSPDASYDGDDVVILVDEVESDRIVANITDNDRSVIEPDEPGVVITQTRGSTDVSEDGETDVYRVALNTVPTETVTVTLNPNRELDLGNGAGRPIEITFAPDDTALTAQRVRVTAVDDGDEEGNHRGRILHSVSSNDADYDGDAVLIQIDGTATDRLRVNITDNDGDVPVDGCRPGVNRRGTDGDDTLRGTRNSDTLRGLAGNDLLIGRRCRDRLIGGDGRDRLRGGSEDDILKGNLGNDRLRGGDGNDTLNGGGRDDRLFGQDGADTLMGKRGGDRLNGGRGRDILNGGFGDDTLTGGGGADRFVYESINEGTDLITDFRRRDRIDLSAITSRRRFDSSTPFEDYVEIIQIGDDTVVGMNNASGSGFRPLAILENVEADDISVDNFIL